MKMELQGYILFSPTLAKVTLELSPLLVKVFTERLHSSGSFTVPRTFNLSVQGRQYRGSGLCVCVEKSTRILNIPYVSSRFATWRFPGMKQGFCLCIQQFSKDFSYISFLGFLLSPCRLSPHKASFSRKFPNQTKSSMMHPLELSSNGDASSCWKSCDSTSELTTHTVELCLKSSGEALHLKSVWF